MGPKEDYLNWKRQSRVVGCMFARYLATKPTQCGQRLVVSNSETAAGCARYIDKTVTQFVAESAASAVTILMPRA